MDFIDPTIGIPVAVALWTIWVYLVGKDDKR